MIAAIYARKSTDQNVADEASAGVQHSHTGIVPRTG